MMLSLRVDEEESAAWREMADNEPYRLAFLVNMKRWAVEDCRTPDAGPVEKRLYRQREVALDRANQLNDEHRRIAR